MPPRNTRHRQIRGNRLYYFVVVYSIEKNLKKTFFFKCHLLPQATIHFNATSRKQKNKRTPSMYIHSHLRTRRDIITFVYCTYKHMLKWPERFEDRLFTM